MTTGQLVKASEYAVTKSAENVGEIIKANLGNSGLSPNDLDRIKMPTGGGLQWTVNTVSGEAHLKELVGIVVHWSDEKAYWAKSLGDGAAPGNPDCFSRDGVTGKGLPGGNCKNCLFNKFESAKGGKAKGKACKDMRSLFMIRKDDMLPVCIVLPPTSITVVRKYFTRLVSAGLPVYAVETRLELDKAKNDAGIAYAVVRPSMVRVADKETLDKILAFMSGLKSSLSRIRVATEVGPDEVGHE
jgi:hypothetical protein